MKFAPVTTLEDLATLDNADVLDGYASAERGDPEPGENRGRAFWHGWRCRMFDYGELKADDGHRRLVKAWVERTRSVEKSATAEHCPGSAELTK